MWNLICCLCLISSNKKAQLKVATTLCSLHAHLQHPVLKSAWKIFTRVSVLTVWEETEFCQVRKKRQLIVMKISLTRVYFVEPPPRQPQQTN